MVVKWTKTLIKTRSSATAENSTLAVHFVVARLLSIAVIAETYAR